MLTHSTGSILLAFSLHVQIITRLSSLDYMCPSSVRSCLLPGIPKNKDTQLNHAPEDESYWDEETSRACFSGVFFSLLSTLWLCRPRRRFYAQTKASTPTFRDELASLFSAGDWTQREVPSHAHVRLGERDTREVQGRNNGKGLWRIIRSRLSNRSQDSLSGCNVYNRAAVIISLMVYCSNFLNRCMLLPLL